MPTIKVQVADQRKPESLFLLKHAANVHSQFGEDGILSALFDIIGRANRWCVEFGAWDGVYLSNTCDLIRRHGWKAVQIEGSAKKFETLKANFAGNDNVRQICALVGFERGVNTLDDILARSELPEDFDLLSIDIDGNDWYVWESITDYRPRVVVIEYNPTIPNDVLFIQDKDMSLNEGCSLSALIDLGKAKGYELVACTVCNAIFVTREDFPKLGIADNGIDAMHLGARGRIFYGYNGKIYHTLASGTWKLAGTTIAEPDSLQLLPAHERLYGDRVTSG